MQKSKTNSVHYRYDTRSHRSGRRYPKKNVKYWNETKCNKGLDTTITQTRGDWRIYVNKSNDACLKSLSYPHKYSNNTNMYRKGIYPQNGKEETTAADQMEDPRGVPTYNREDGVSWNA